MILYSELETTELIEACVHSDHSAAWRAFVARYQRQISLSIIRTVRQWGLSPQELVDDLVQETYLKLCSDRCRRLLAFAVQHPESVDGYIKTTATNVALDYIKAQRSLKRGKGEVGQFLENMEPLAPPASMSEEDFIQRAILLSEIDRCLEQCSEPANRERDRIIFWLHYQQGMAGRAIAALPGVGLTTKGVESAILRLTKQVRERLNLPHSHQMEKTGLPPKDFGRAESF